MQVAFKRIYVLSTVLTVGVRRPRPVLRRPVDVRYEAVITNLVTGLAFAAGAGGSTPLLQDIAARQQGAPFPDRADVRRFFELFTLAWACYFVAFL